MALEFDDKFGLVFKPESENISLDEMRYVINIETGRCDDQLYLNYQPDTNMCIVDEFCPSYKTFDEQISFYTKLISCIKKIRKQVEG